MSARQKAGLPDSLAEIDSFTLGESKLDLASLPLS